jgi:light-regulated signal transduction histidine kinase (bacteriophytochrome)
LRSSVEQLETLSPDILSALDPAQTQLWQVTTRDKIPTAVRFINTAVDRMDQFTAAILKLSRLGHRQLTFETIDVNDLVQKIINSLLPESDPREIEIVVEELPDVEADRVALDQILGNIISNAIKYLDLRRKGEIVIFGEQNELLTTFHMRDNGRGIAEAQYDKIFAPFRRGISDVEGEGMGLAYVQALVKRHRGDIWFESTPDVGSTFSFTILNRKASPDGAL